MRGILSFVKQSISSEESLRTRTVQMYRAIATILNPTKNLNLKTQSLIT